MRRESGAAKKAADAARKPENQQKMKQMWSKFRGQQGEEKR